MKKDTIYIDIEDDITAIIDKVKSSQAKIVALVPPKRSTTLNSAVNMKLLIKTAEEAGKRVVLVTSEASLVGLAGGVGLYVAQNLHSKPAVPETSAAPTADDSVIDGNELDPSVPVGELDEVHSATEAAPEGQSPAKSAKPKSKKGLKIPSFDKFRGRLLLIIGAVILLGLGWWWAFWLAPKAIIAIDAQTSEVDIAFEFTADSQLSEDDFDKNLFAAQKVEQTKTVTEEFTPTGKKNIGDKASGPVEVRNESGVPHTIESGTIFTSGGGLKFEATETATVPGATVDENGNKVLGTVDMQLRSVAPGTQYNLASGEVYDIDGVGSLVYGVGGQMSGGTDKNVTVVAQKDVDAAKKKLQSADKEAGISDLRDELSEDMVPINETYQIKLGEVTALPSVGQEADRGNVSAEATLTMLAVKRDTLTKALEDFLNAKIEGGNQTIYQSGIDNLVFAPVDDATANTAVLELTTTGFIGPNLNTGQLAEEISGMKYSETVNYIKSRPGVVEVDVNFEPFWVFSAPRPNKIEFVLNVNDAAG